MAGHNHDSGPPKEIEESVAEITAPTAMRKLVLNYLIHHCYVDTAQAFADDGISSSTQMGNVDEAGPSKGMMNKVHNSSNGKSGGGHSRSSSRQNGGSSAHPLSAPPLSHDDSSMEVEIDGLLSLAGDTSTEKGPTRTGNEELSAEDIRSIKARKAIKDCIINGRIKQAVELCNKHFPTVLNGPVQTVQDNGKKNATEVERILPANPTSLDPAHLSLNLQIQSFIECVRAASVNSATSFTPSIPARNSHQGTSAMPNMHSVVSNTPGIAAAAAISRSASPAPSSVSSAGSITSGNGMSASINSNGGSSTANDPNLLGALQGAQKLWSDVQKLPAYWRAMYLKELESVTSMLAYRDLLKSPVSKYLDQSRRVALAEQINSAIMLRTGKPSQPLIESAVRQTTFCWQTLANEKVVLPANHWVFSNGSVVGSDGFEGGVSTAVSTGVNPSNIERAKKAGKTLPSWDLHGFLQER
ncbi:hypothetical protein L7F22_052878 [Adiantum nelumboides]|nr:hypothetical protein [Adiantum nelumboides]